MNTENITKIAEEMNIPVVNEATLKTQMRNAIRGYNQIYSDDSWKPVHEIIQKLGDILPTIGVMESKYDGKVPPTSKEWILLGAFRNQQEVLRACWVRIGAFGAGSVDDPLDRYDLAVQIETASPRNLDPKLRSYFTDRGLVKMANQKIPSMLDSIANRLEAQGLMKEAYEIDKVADELDAFAIDPKQQTPKFEFLRELKRTPGSSQHNEAIRLNNGLVLSIQGSSSHYCTPRKDSPDPTIYSRYETAVWGPKETKNYLVIPGFETEANKYDYNIMPVIPADLVEKIYQAAKRLTADQIEQMEVSADHGD